LFSKDDKFNGSVSKWFEVQDKNYILCQRNIILSVITLFEGFKYIFALSHYDVFRVQHIVVFKLKGIYEAYKADLHK
jgi:hypothetical protein